MIVSTRSDLRTVSGHVTAIVAKPPEHRNSSTCEETKLMVNSHMLGAHGSATLRSSKV
jgi:hypothetical protein